MRWLLSLFVLMLPMVARAITVDEMLAKIDANMTFESRETTMTMKVVKNGREKVYKMHSFGRGQDEAATEYLEPARDKGTKMLKKGDELWMYMPSVEKTQKISGHMLRQSMMGSDLSYEDMMQAAAWKKSYTGTIAGEETIEGRKTWKLDMKANDATVSYPHRVVWVDQQTYTPLRQELYALSGMLLKVWLMSDVKDFGGRQFPTHMVIEDKVQQGSRTELVFDSVAFAVPLQEEVFSLRWLER